MLIIYWAHVPTLLFWCFCKDNIVITSCRVSCLLGCGTVSFVEYFLTVLRNVRKILPNRTASHSLKIWIFNNTSVRTSSVASHNTVLTHLASFWICFKLCDLCLRFLFSCCPWRPLAAALHQWRTVVFGCVSLTCGKLLLASNPLTPNDPYRGRTAPLTSKRCILYIYSTNIGTEYFKRGIYSQFFSLQNAVCFIILTYLVPVLFTFYIQGVLKFKKIIPAPKG